MVEKSRHQDLKAAGHTAAEISKSRMQKCMLLLTSLAQVILSQAKNGATQSGHVVPQTAYIIPHSRANGPIPLFILDFFQVLHFIK